jgi:hypothetical protein
MIQQLLQQRRQPAAQMLSGIKPAVMSSNVYPDASNPNWQYYMARRRAGDPTADPNMQTGAPNTTDPMATGTGPGKATNVADVTGGGQPYNPERGYIGQYDTPLNPEQESKFQQWLQQQSATRGRDMSQDMYDYDLRGAWLSGAEAAANGHLPDTFKKPNHPTFSDQSKYSTPQMPGGVWAPQQGGTWSFTPTSHNLRMNSPEDLQQYWQKVEPGNKLVLPTTQAQPASGAPQ